MRAVADAVGAAPMSLYSHVRDKAELLEGAAALALERLDVDLQAEGTWLEKLSAWMRSLHRQLLGCPEIAELMDKQSWNTPQLLRVVRRPIRILVEAGFEESVASEAVQAMVWTAIGFFVLEDGQRRRAETASPEAQLAAALATMSDDEKAEIEPLLRHLRTGDFDVLYDSTVRRLLKGLESERSVT
jgi:AcrR family transcriptional regulator